MNSVFIYSKLGWALLSQPLPSNIRRERGADSTLLWRDGQRVYVRILSPDDLEPGGDWEAIVAQRLGVPFRITSLDYSDIELVKDIIVTTCNDPEVLVDDDHDMIVSGVEFVDMVRRTPMWDWRGSRRRT